jgi:hypothetical protein
MKSATLLLALCLASVALLASASATSAGRRTTPWHALEGISFHFHFRSIPIWQGHKELRNCIPIIISFMQ